MAVNAKDIITNWAEEGAFDHEVVGVSVVLLAADGSFVTVSHLPRNINAELLLEASKSMAEDDGEDLEEKDAA